MEGHQRGRSPSSAHQNNIRHTPSPSPHGSFRNSIGGQGLDAANQFANNGFNGQLNPSTASFDQQSHFLTLNQQQQFPQQTDLAQHTFLQAQGIPSQNQPGGNFGQQGNNIFNNQFLDPSSSQGNSGVFDAQFMSSASAPQGTIDPSAFLIDPGLDNSQPQQQSVDPSNLLNQMGSGHTQSPTPPPFLQPEMHRHSSGGSPHASPSLQQGGFSPGHSRNTSLDPNRPAFPHNLSAEWAAMNQYRSHQRTPSDAYSDASSVQHSPYMGNNDNFDANEQQPSPLLSGQDPGMFQDISHFGQFSISESQSRHISPVPSPHISPHLGPQQQQLPPFTSADNFGLSSGLNNTAFGDQQLNMFTPPQGQEPFPSMPQGASVDYGHADAMTPPDITIQLAPPSRQSSFEPPKPEPASEGALSPPGGRKPRSRAQSAPNSRATTPSGGRLSLSSGSSSLSPSAARMSRSPSPSNKGSRRASTSSVQDRTYLIGLADPNRSESNASNDGSSPGKGRTQKHPATFQCSLCPKRFTRAYNLRSHLRTHTDERPFVCSVCGKAFARQHDRKRHEGLHSGEKKFVCRGTLKDGDNWGCGRRFARADALGRHFRSEAGRVCIRPLLEEEAKEKGLSLSDGQNGENTGGLLGPYVQGIPGQPMQVMPHQGFGGPYQPQSMSHVPLPAALLAQYPALGNMWDTLPTGNDDMEGDVGARSSFDAGSGYEDEDNEFSNLGTSPGNVALGWASDYDTRA